MATVSGTPAASSLRLPNRRVEHAFFQAMAVLLTVTMIIGFARTYFLAGVFQARLPKPVIHIHGAVFTCWFLLLLAQSALASLQRVDLHRRLGIAGVVIAALMLPLGIMATAEYVAREAAQRWIVLAAVMPIAELTTFSVLVSAAFLLRRSPDLHKRLIILATTALMGAAVGRMAFVPLWHLHGIAVIRLVWAYTYIFIVPIAVFDLWSTRKLNRATAWGSVFMISVQQGMLLVATSAPWNAFVRWMQSWGI
jgi:hypothetical protein